MWASEDNKRINNSKRRKFQALKILIIAYSPYTLSYFKLDNIITLKYEHCVKDFEKRLQNF